MKWVLRKNMALREERRKIMRLKIKLGKGLGKIEVEIDEGLWRGIKGLGERYGISEGYILRITVLVIRYFWNM